MLNSTAGPATREKAGRRSKRAGPLKRLGAGFRRAVSSLHYGKASTSSRATQTPPYPPLVNEGVQAPAVPTESKGVQFDPVHDAALLADPTTPAENLPELKDACLTISPVLAGNARLPLRPFRAGMPPEAATLWPVDLQRYYSPSKTITVTPPELYRYMEHQMTKSLRAWRKLCDAWTDDGLWEPEGRHVVARMARHQAQAVLFWQEQLWVAAPGVLRTQQDMNRILTPDDYPEQHLKTSNPGDYAMSDIMRLVGFEPVRLNDIERFDFFQGLVLYKIP